MNRKLAATALLLLGIMPAYGASGVPRLNYQETCRQTPPVNGDQKTTVESCLNDEKDALAALPPVWAKSSPASRQQCTAETTQGGLPSYVELLTCLQGNLLIKN